MSILKFVVVIVVVHASLASSSRISGGVNSQKGDFPFVVSLQLFGFHYCAGSILNDRWILTAARCAMPFEMEIVAGVYDLNVAESSQQSATSNVSIVHPDFNSEIVNSPNDIALLKLSTPLMFNDWVKPIQIPVKGETAAGNATLVGWGRTSGESEHTRSLANILQEADVQLLSYNECLAALSSIHANDSLDANTDICTGPLDGRVSVCTGDSGDPLSQKDASGNRILVGVASWPVTPCGRQGAPSIHTSVAAFSQWITSTMLHNTA